jgi:adenylylsulfate kinase-like enzyme
MQCETIRRIAEQGPAVIVGRCADYVLRDDENMISVFLTSPLEARVERVMQRDGLSYEEAMEILSGVTLESLVVARRVAKAIYRKAELGMLDLADFPLMVHANDVLDNGKDAQLPWESFTFDNTK